MITGLQDYVGKMEAERKESEDVRILKRQCNELEQELSTKRAKLESLETEEREFRAALKSGGCVALFVDTGGSRSRDSGFFIVKKDQLQEWKEHGDKFEWDLVDHYGDLLDTVPISSLLRQAVEISDPSTVQHLYVQLGREFGYEFLRRIHTKESSESESESDP